jgi:hypothetical protein
LLVEFQIENIKRKKKSNKMLGMKSMNVTSIVKKYPSFRDDLIKGCWRWLEGRCVDDNAEELWRVHDKIYDLSDFANKHPGGREWIDMTKVSGKFYN